MAWGYNHVPGLHGDALEMVLATRVLKYPRVIHAEVDAIAFAARRGRPTDGLTMICPWAACLRCVGPILEAGIKKLVVHKQRFYCPYGAWNEEIDAAHAWLSDAGVELIAYDGAIPLAPPVLVNYQEWQP